MSDLLEIRLGERALSHIRERGLAPGDVTCIPAAAGGPKGLALLPLDRILARHWLPHTDRIELIGASIGAWRSAALAQDDPLAALDRLQHAYVREQNYAEKPSAREVGIVCRGLARAVLGGLPLRVRNGVSLSVITARARGALINGGTKHAFGRAALSNAMSRRWLATHMERVVFHSGAPSPLTAPFDAFGLTRITLNDHNAEDALLASGSIPIVCEPVRDIADAPLGSYWDGGLIDYHLLLPYAKYQGIVLYPHFVPHVTPGWLDKFLPWRLRSRHHEWLANMVLIAPSRSMLAKLPNRKLPDRNDFYHYGTDHAQRIRDWEKAISESERFATAAMQWIEKPDLKIVKPL